MGGETVARGGWTRRSMLKTGVLGALLVGGGGWLAVRLTDGRPVAMGEFDQLSAGDQRLLARVAEAVLDDMLPADPAARAEWLGRVVRNIDMSFSVLPQYLLDETRRLFGLLDLAPARYALTGQWASWDDASVPEVQATLQRLRGSSRSLRRSVYMVLRDTVVSAFYGDRESWSLIGYPGPMLDNPANG